MSIDEDGFLAAFLPTLKADNTVIVPPGDDCAALDFGAGPLVLAAVDQIAADAHYCGPDSASPTPPELAGRKLLARNLSDIAAMGGTPRYALTSIGMPSGASAERLQEFANGIRELAESHGVSLIGGDLGCTPSEGASLTIMGTVDRETICLRDRAAVGDHIYVTGAFGNSLESGRHLTFTPRLEEGRWLAERGLTCCMIDTSDGLLKDLQRVCKASKVQAVVDEDNVPIHEDATLDQALLDGEDYELIIAIPAKFSAQLPELWPFPTPLTKIGRFQEGDATIIDSQGTDLQTRHGSTFDHFKS
ncbi:thiamine-phosphate kinase [bacterium M21]|nr:thiamine-phosphate kinase [bacterium M21]